MSEYPNLDDTSENGEDEALVSVSVNKSTYVQIKSKALERRVSVRKYITSLLDSYVKKYEFADQQWPGLSVDGFDENNKNHIILKDSKKRKSYDIRLVKDELQCEQDNSKCCIHTRYVWLMPEFSKMGIKEPKQ